MPCAPRSPRSRPSGSRPAGRLAASRRWSGPAPQSAGRRTAPACAPPARPAPARRPGGCPAWLLAQVLDESGLTAYYADDPRRSQTLRELIRAFELLDDSRLEPAEALYRVVSHTALARNLEQLDDSGDRVAIITIHQAK